MSFPNIPDIDPYINITFEDAVNLLLTSIAMEEMSLSRLMDAEVSKIACVTGDRCHPDGCHPGCGQGGRTPGDVLKINKSVDEAIKNMIKLQMLLQFKLDNIKEILPCTSSTTTTTSTSTTTSSHTTTCAPPTCSDTTVKDCGCCLTGGAKGCVSNPCDEFFDCPAVLHAFVFCFGCAKDRSVRYSAVNGETRLRMNASGYNVRLRCPDRCADNLVIHGRGFAEKRSHGIPVISGSTEFVLTVRKADPGGADFRMEIRSKKAPELDHDSGFVSAKSGPSGLWLRT